MPKDKQLPKDKALPRSMPRSEIYWAQWIQLPSVTMVFPRAPTIFSSGSWTPPRTHPIFETKVAQEPKHRKSDFRSQKYGAPKRAQRDDSVTKWSRTFSAQRAERAAERGRPFWCQTCHSHFSSGKLGRCFFVGARQVESGFKRIFVGLPASFELSGLSSSQEDQHPSAALTVVPVLPASDSNPERCPGSSLSYWGSSAPNSPGF